jgi:nucleoside-diphosphate-sugar epimerase
VRGQLLHRQQGQHRPPAQQSARFELMRHDVTFPLYVEVDEIYNLACPASPVHYQHDPVQTTKTSVHGAINMLGLAKRLRAHILQASTGEVYGDPRFIRSRSRSRRRMDRSFHGAGRRDPLDAEVRWDNLHMSVAMS